MRTPQESFDLIQAMDRWDRSFYITSFTTVHLQQIRDKVGRTLLHLACRWGDEQLVHHLIRKGLSVHELSDNGETALHEAVRSVGYAEVVTNIVRMLLESGINVRVKNDQNVLALHLACFHGPTDVVTLLLRAGSDMFARTKAGTLPITYSFNTLRSQYLQRCMDRYTLMSIAYVRRHIFPMELMREICMYL